MSDTLSSLPSSSPISVPTTASMTPIQVASSTNLREGTVQPDNLGGTNAESYEDFWAQFDTPIIADANLPAALQTPSTLTIRDNVSIPPSQWPPLNQAGINRAIATPGNEENMPPSLVPSASHPPVASRFRKRRRGASPAIGERAKKSARRKAKGKDAERVPPSQSTTTPFNPWASTPAAAALAPASTTIDLSSPLHPTSYASTNHTPYQDFSREASSTTTFYRRMNASGSHPTPHRMTFTPSAQASPSPAETSLPDTSIIAASTSAAFPSPLQTPRLRSASNELPLEEDERYSTVHATPAASSSRMHGPPGEDDISMRSLSQRDRLSDRPDDYLRRELAPGAGTRASRDRPYRSPTVDDYPEDGEIEDLRHSYSVRAEGWEPRISYERFSSTQYGPTLSMSDASRRPTRPSDHNRSTARLPSEADYPASRPAAMHDEDSRARAASIGARVDVRARAGDATHMLDSARRPNASNPNLSSSPAHSVAAFTTAPANRLGGLDVFDIGHDENVPDAVRRGGAYAADSSDRPTPIPHEGDPEVHQYDPEAHLRGMSDDWIQEVWADPEGTSITLSTFNPRFTRSYGTNRRTASDIRQAVASITGESAFLVIAPDQAQGHRGRGPFEWAVTGLTTDGADRLLRRRVWSLKYITFFPRRRTLESPRLLLALEGFLDDNISNIQNAVRSTFERPQIRQRMLQMINANSDFSAIPAEEALRRIMSSLRITVYTLDNGTVVANVFLRSPTLSIRVWRLWVQELRSLTFGSYHTAIARARRITSCAGCTGVDHPSHLCPFTRMQGWNGPDIAGGYSYSVDGRERAASQSTSTPPTQTNSSAMHGYHSQLPSNLGGGVRAASARRHDSRGDRDADGHEAEQGYSRGQDRGRGRRNDQGSQGLSRRDRHDGSRPSKGGRDGTRKDTRR